jgi:histidine ammonia-lyase
MIFKDIRYYSTISLKRSGLLSRFNQNIHLETNETTTNMTRTTTTMILNGEDLTCEQLYHIGYFADTVHIELSTESIDRVLKSREVIDDILKKDKVKYGINTGFGQFARVTIDRENLEILQQNLIRSHAAGVGKPLPIERARMLLALRINVLAKGYSGIRLETLHKLVNALNKNCVSLVPEKGTVGASGDLAPLSHMALGMMGEGKMWNPLSKQFEDAAKVLKENDLEPITLEAKEGLALINGTQFICALGAEALVRAERLAKQADIVAALSIEALRGSNKAFDARIHNARKHNGQKAVAARLRSLLFDSNSGQQSEIADSHKNCNRVQDAYTLRCTPQVHGIVHDTIDFCLGILDTELNSATDNPMVFSDVNGSEIDGWNEHIVSGGNFHGEYPAKSVDYGCIGIQEIANISERRIARMLDPALSDLPAFLVKGGGLNSGFMIAHCTASALASENKVLVHPSSSDTLSTSASQEDHVSMGGFSSVKMLQVVENVEYVVAIELLCAAQALEFHRPLKTTPALESVYNLVRSKVAYYDKDRFMTPDIEAVRDLIRNNEVWETVKEFVPAEYQ